MDEVRRRLGALSPEQREQLRRRLSDGRPPIGPRPPGAEAPLSWSQEHLWEVHRREPGTTAYTIALRLDLRGALDAAALEASFALLLRRHEALRTGIVAEGGGAAQRVAAAPALALPLVDLSGLPPERRAAEQALLEETEARRLFDLARPPLLRATLLRLEARHHALLLCLHHMVADGWSVGVLLRELLLLYAAGADGGRAGLPALPIQYADYAAWQRRWAESPALTPALERWRAHLADPPAPLDLPAAHAEPDAPHTAGALHCWDLPAALVADMRRRSERAGATPFMLMLAALCALLRELTGRSDLLVGTPIASRRRAETEPLVGLFVNLLPLRIDLAGADAPDELLARVRAVCLEAYEQQDTPYLLLERAVQPGGGAPLFNLVFNVQNTPRPAAGPPGLAVASAELSNGGARYDLTWSVLAGEDDAWQLLVERRRARVGRADLDAWVARWLALLER